MSSDEALIPVGCFDYIFTNLYGVYFFPKRLSHKSLQLSLTKTIKTVLPVLSSIIVEIKGIHYFKPTLPSNIQIFEKEIEDDLFKMYCIDSKTHTYIKEEAKKFFENVEMIKFNENVRKPILNIPLLKITLLQVKSGGSVLCVSINHCLADAHSLAYFMKAWSDIHTSGKSEIKKFSFSRDPLKMTDGFNMYKCSKKCMNNLREIHPNKVTKPENEGFTVLPGKECIDTMINFSPEDIKQLKKVAGEGYSSNDCVSAFLWILHSAISGKPEQEIIPFTIVVNIRDRFSKLDKTFFGNALTVVNLDCKKKFILEEEYSKIVKSVRGLINNCNDDLIQTTVDCINYVIKENITEIWGKCRRKTAIFMNDWRVKDRLRPNFGESKCSRVIWNPPNGQIGLPQIFTVMVAENGGVDVLVTFKTEVWEKIKTFELSNLEVLKKIKTMEF